jgi:integrase/recombinase XerD
MSNLEHTQAAVEQQQELFTPPEELALAGFLAGYSGHTLEAYRLDLRQFVGWCTEHRLALFGARRADIERFGRHLEALGRARATVARRLGTIVCFYRYAEEEGLIERSPAVHVRRPRLDYESHAVGLDRNEVGALLVAAGLAGARDHALVSLLALNGLRVSEATGADIERLAVERGHRTLTICRKGGKVVTIPMAPAPPGPLISPWASEPRGRSSSVRTDAASTATPPGGSCGDWPDRQASPRPSGHTPLRHAFITAALDAGVPLRDVQEAASHADPRTTMRYDRGRVSLDRHATYVVSAFLAGAAR